MRRITGSVCAVVLLVSTTATAQAQDASRAVSGGGVTVQGWTGKIDDSRENQGLKLEDAKFAREGQGFHITTGPAATYWNPANTASGNYTVKATFREPKFMGLNNHAHPYGIMIAGNDLGTPNASYLYCSVYGNGTFIVRGFGPAAPAGGGAPVSTAFQVNGRRAEPNDAINKAPANNEPVTQEIALSVNGDKVECSVNGKVVGSYNKADLVAAGKLKSTDGVYGIRIGHNTEAVVTGFTMTKN